MGKVVARCGDQPPALTRSDAFRCSAERTSAAHAHLHEYDSLTFEQDQVDLAKAASVIALFELQSLLKQEAQSPILRLRAAGIHGRVLGCMNRYSPFRRRHGLAEDTRFALTELSRDEFSDVAMVLFQRDVAGNAVERRLVRGRLEQILRNAVGINA